MLAHLKNYTRFVCTTIHSALFLSCINRFVFVWTLNLFLQHICICFIWSTDRGIWLSWWYDNLTMAPYTCSPFSFFLLFSCFSCFPVFLFFYLFVFRCCHLYSDKEVAFQSDGGYLQAEHSSVFSVQFAGCTLFSVLLHSLPCTIHCTLYYGRKHSKTQEGTE